MTIDCMTLPQLSISGRHLYDPSFVQAKFANVRSSTESDMKLMVQTPSDAVLTLVSPYFPDNIGHALGDDLFPVYQALTMFSMQDAARVVVSLSSGSLPEHAAQLYSSSLLELRGLPDLQGQCFNSVVLGLSGLTFTRPLRHGTGIILDEFSDWLVRRANISRDERSVRNLSITIIQKDFSHSDHPHGLHNGPEIADWCHAAFPGASVRVMYLSQVSIPDQMRTVSNTDVLISSPGSDLMAAVYLPRGSAMIVVCYCVVINPDGTCLTNMGLEFDQWYHERGSVYTLPYCNITKDMVVDAGGESNWEGFDHQRWHQVKVVKDLFMPYVHDAVRFVEDQRNGPSKLRI